MLISAHLDCQSSPVQDTLCIFVTKFELRITHVQLYNVTVLEKVLVRDFKYISLEMLLVDCFYGTNLFKVVTKEGFHPPPINLWKAVWKRGGKAYRLWKGGDEDHGLGKQKLLEKFAESRS